MFFCFSRRGDVCFLVAFPQGPRGIISSIEQDTSHHVFLKYCNFVHLRFSALIPRSYLVRAAADRGRNNGPFPICFEPGYGSEAKCKFLL